MRKWIGVLILLLALALCATAAADRSGTWGANITWTQDDNGVVTISGTGEMGDTRSGYFDLSVTKVIVEEGVTSIADSAFCYSSYLTEVILPNSLVKIGRFAFDSCSGLKSVKLPPNITEIGESAFYFWSTTFYADFGSATAKALGRVGCLFVTPDTGFSYYYDESEDYGTELLLEDVPQDVVSVTVPEGVQVIASNAFSGCESLTDVTLPASLRRIRYAAFENCPKLTQLFIPDGVTEVDSSLFGWPGSSTIQLLANIGSGGAKALSKADYSFRTPGGKYDLRYQFEVGDEEACRLAVTGVPAGSKSIAVPEGVQVLAQYAVKDCTKLKKVTLPASLEAIESYAFSNCPALKRIDLPAQIREISWGSFENCPKLVLYAEIGSDSAKALSRANLTFHTDGGNCSLQYIYDNYDKPPTALAMVDYDDRKATTVTVPEGVTTIKYFSFQGFAKLKKIKLPSTLESLDTWTLAGLNRETLFLVKKGSKAERIVRGYGLSYDNGKKRVAGYDITNLSEKVDWVVSNYITPGMSEREKVRVLNNWLTMNAHYDSSYTYHGAEGVMILGYGVCDSYSYAFELLATRAGLANRRLTGNAVSGYGGGGHAWNLVRVDGQWYHIDTTWNDPVDISVPNSEIPHISGYECHEYFLVTDAQIGKDHTWAAGISADSNQVGSYHSNGIDYLYAAEGNYELNGSSHTAVLTVGKKSAKNVSIPATVSFQGAEYRVTEIRADAFKGSKKLTKLTIGKNVKTIGAGAFQNCAKLKTISGMTGVTKVGDSAFQNCKALTALTIPAKVKTIGKSAFSGCKKLKTITIKTTKLTAKTVGANAFKGVYKKATVKVPKKKLKAYKSLLVKKGLPKTATVKK